MEIEVEQELALFCEVVNAAMTLDRSSRNAALEKVPLPAGYEGVILRHADGRFISYHFPSPGGKISASAVGISLVMAKASRVKPSEFKSTRPVSFEFSGHGSILNLEIADGDDRPLIAQG